MYKILEKMEAAAEAEYEKILAKWGVSVSYTHLTLPTICSV